MTAHPVASPIIEKTALQADDAAIASSGIKNLVGPTREGVTRAVVQEVETVHIPDEDRGTLCVSSQVGCSLACSFCHTGTQQFVRNLAAPEIVAQIMAARDALGEWPSPKSDRMISNIVMMG